MLRNNILDNFAIDVFTDSVCKKYLDGWEFNAYIALKETNGKLDQAMAVVVANAVKEWAISQGATHFCHWFSSLNDITSEKYDSFLSLDAGKPVLAFSYKQLMQGETDASSFPHGGLRSTFEARGYTLWDISSPMFLKTFSSGLKVLCVPTSLCSFHGRALDKKTPLLRARKELATQIKRLLSYLGIESKKIIAYAGAEQEYFLIDREKFDKRQDLALLGRTVFGASAIKKQGGQYYSVTTERTNKFMKDLNEELWRLGIPAKTQHSEAAPRQFEIAPIYEEINIANDHNLLTMEIMRKIARQHNLKVVFHEKPFQGFNGSGKHNNFSLAYVDNDNNEHNLFDMKNHELFSIFFCLIMTAVDRYAELFRLSCASYSNDLRLGGHEAPPPIMSIFAGSTVLQLVQNFLGLTENTCIDLKTDSAELAQDEIYNANVNLSDRNRTSPFAFVDNKFEFRLVGASSSIAIPNIILCTTLSNVIKDMLDELDTVPKTNDSLKDIIKKLFNSHQRIIYSGNNYSKEWENEAKLRGLPLAKTCVEAFQSILSDKALKLFNSAMIFELNELNAYLNFLYDNYINTAKTEINFMIDMCQREIIPTCISYMNTLAKAINNMSLLKIDCSVSKKAITKYNKLVIVASKELEKLEQLVDIKNLDKDSKTLSVYFVEQVIPQSNQLRHSVDELEKLTPRNIWPTMSYDELLF